VVAVLAVAVLAVCHAQFFSPGLYQQKQALARRFGIIEKNENKGLRLKCIGSRHAARKGISVAEGEVTISTDRMLTVTIQMKPHDSGSSSSHQHHHHFGRSYLGSPFGGSAAALAFGGPAYAVQTAFGRQAPYAFGVQQHLNHGNSHKNKLTANIEVLNGLTGVMGTAGATDAVTGKYKIILTERGTPATTVFTTTDIAVATNPTLNNVAARGTQCSQETFGPGLKVDDVSHDHGHGHIGAFAGPAAFFHGHSHHFTSTRNKDPFGVIGEIDFGSVAPARGTNGATASVTRSSTIDKIKGFHDLEDLDGRGIILCKADMVDEDFEGKAECSMFEAAFCCGLTYEKDTKSTTG